MGSKKAKKQCLLCCKNLKKLINKVVGSSQPQEVCYPCWITYLQTTIEDTFYEVGSDIDSPIDERTFTVAQCLESLNKNDRIKFQEKILKKYISMTKDIGQCPSVKCNYAYVDSKCNKKNKICPQCSHKLTVSKSFSIRQLFSNIHLSLINKCPNCQIPVQKIDGCPHMTCACSHEFCWYCFKDFYYTSGKVYSEHNDFDCPFISISKVVLLVICIGGLLLSYSQKYDGKWLFSRTPSILFFILKFIVIDIIIFFQMAFFVNIGQYITANQYQRPYDFYKIQQAFAIAIVDGLLYFVLYYFQILYPTFVFLFVALVSQIVVAGIFFGAVFIYDRRQRNRHYPQYYNQYDDE